MKSLNQRIINRINNTKKKWRSDSKFSKRFAWYRVVYELGGRIGLNRIAQLAKRKKDKYILNYLYSDLKQIIEKYDKDYCDGERVTDAPIWVCWLAGYDAAPPLVKKCIDSIIYNSGSHPVNIITENNIASFLSVPEWILNKVKNNSIGPAHFSDYLRVCLLEKYGGLWLDATIFCPVPIPTWFFDFPLFTCKSEYQETGFISHYEWTTFCLGGWKGNSFYSFLKEALELYWKRTGEAIDYLLFDYLIYIARENIYGVKRQLDAVPVNTPHRDDLQAAMNASIEAKDFWNIIQSDTQLYKLSWREKYKKKAENGKDTVYGYFLKLKPEKTEHNK